MLATEVTRVKGEDVFRGRQAASSPEENPKTRRRSASVQPQSKRWYTAMQDETLFKGDEKAIAFFKNLMEKEAQEADQVEKLLYRERIFHEALPPVKELFDSLDSDGDGQLTLEELRVALTQLGIDPSSLGQWISVIDADQNKFISFEEFDVFVTVARDYIWPRDRVQLDGSSVNVFLGGSCNPTNWRQTVAIPLLERANATYYNPQVKEWYPALIEEEARAKDTASILFFVIDGKTRAIASMLEVAENIAAKEKEVVLVICDVPSDTSIEGEKVTAIELKDLNRGRAYLADIAHRHGVVVYSSVHQALLQCLKKLNSMEVVRIQSRVSSYLCKLISFFAIYAGSTGCREERSLQEIQCSKQCFRDRTEHTED
jgi:hypothetical protein